jgi:hypothetical protein
VRLRSRNEGDDLNEYRRRSKLDVFDQVVGNKLLLVSIRQDIIERADGIPLFVEEMTKAVLEAGSQGAAEHVVAAVPSPALAVPATLFVDYKTQIKYTESVFDRSKS